MTIATERKGSRGKLAGDKYFNLIEHAADGIAIIQDGVFKLVNTALTHISGYDKSELLGMPFTKLLTPQSQKSTLTRYQARLAGKKVPQIYEIQAVTKDGKIRDIEVNAALTEYEGRVADEVIIRDITERKQAEEALKESGGKLRLMFNSVAEGITITDLNANIIDANEATVLMHGYDKEQLIGRSAFVLISQEDHDKATVNLKKTLEQRYSGILKYMLVRKDGSRFPGELNAALMKDTDGNPIGFIAVTRDITERKQMERALRESEEFSSSLLESSPNPILVLNPDTSIKYVNPALEKLTGFSARELIGRTPPYPYWGQETLQETFRGFEKAIRHGDKRQERLFKKKTGERFWVEITSTPVKTDGEFKYYLANWVDITERKKAEEKIRESENKYRTIFENVSDVIIRLDRYGKIVDVNGRVEEYFGYKPEEVIGKNFAKLGALSLKDLPKMAKIFAEVMRGNRALQTIEIEAKRKDGSPVLIEVTTALIKKDGKTEGTVAIIRDSTERKKAEQALADEATRRRILIDQSLDGIVVLDVNAKVYEANQKFAEMLGYTPEEVRELHTWDWDKNFPPEQLLEMGRNVDEKGLHLETQHHRKDGSVIDVDISVNGAVAAGQKLAFCVCRDITQRKNMEHQLQEKNEQLDAQNEELRSINEELQATEEELQYSRERLERMFESVTDGIVVAALDGTILKVNRSAVQMHGFASDDELLGKNADDLIAPGDRERIRNEMLKVQEKGAIRYQECNLLKADGSEFPAELSTSALKDAAGKVIGRITIARDITERKQAEEREDQLQQELNLAGRLASIGQLAAGVAHEINNPLTGVIGFSHLMLNRDIPDDMKQDLQVIHSEAQRVARIVENLLAFAHQRKTGREYAAINDTITRVLELRAYEMRVNNIEVETQLDPELPLTMADASQLQQVFLNIVLNAEYFMTKAHNRGKLLVKTEKIDGNIRASFTDDGTGISKENLDKIFNPFFTTKEVGKGTGLGLSICHGIVTQHQGRIYAKSQPGKGATFVVELPIVAEPAQAGKAEEVKKEPKKPRGAKILVVDDEAAILTFLSRLLTEWGHSVETIDNANTALEKLRTERYSLILLDIKLPGMSGIELYHHIEEIAPALARRVMFITGDVMEGVTRSFLEKTGAPYITKPLDIEVLKKAINRALNQTQVAATTSA